MRLEIDIEDSRVADKEALRTGLFDLLNVFCTGDVAVRILE